MWIEKQIPSHNSPDNTDIIWTDVNNAVQNILFNGFRFDIDSQEEKITIYDAQNNEVWFIEHGTFDLETYKVDTHLYVEIFSEDHRWNWLGRKLFDLYEEHFWLPEQEHTRKLEKYYFFCSIWYIPTALINDETWEREYFSEDDIDKIWNGYICEFEKE